MELVVCVCVEIRGEGRGERRQRPGEEAWLSSGISRERARISRGAPRRVRTGLKLSGDDSKRQSHDILSLLWNKSRTGANLERCPLESYDGLELAERFGAKICKISRV